MTPLRCLQKGLELVRRDDEFRVEIEEILRADGHAREEMTLIDVDPAKPVAVRCLADPGHLQDLLTIGDRQGKDQRHRTARYQPIGGRGRDPDVPGLHHGAQQAKRQDRHRHAKHRKSGSQPMPQGIANDEFDQFHGKRLMLQAAGFRVQASSCRLHVSSLQLPGKPQRAGPKVPLIVTPAEAGVQQISDRFRLPSIGVNLRMENLL